MPNRARSFRPLPLGFAALIVLVALALPFSIIRVPEAAAGLAGGRVLDPGWHVKRPLSRSHIIPLRGGPIRFDLDRATPEGATIRVRLALEYTVTPDVVGRQAAEIGERGFEGFLRDTIERALNPLPPSTLIAPAAPAGSARRAALPRAALDAIDGALRANGIGPERLEASAGPPGAFAPIPSGAEQELAARGAMPDVDRTGMRLLLIGLDGADWDVIDPLLRSGRMPHLARLIGEGARGRLRSYDPMISPLLWTTMVTGVGPDRHRIADFQAIDAATGRRIPITSRFRGVKALWNILGDAGLTTGFVAWWASYPAERVSGVQVSNLVAFETLRPRDPSVPFSGGIAFPGDYLDGIRHRLITAADLTYEEARRVMRIERGEFEEAVAKVIRLPGGEDGALNKQMAQNPAPLVLSILTGSRNYAAIAADLASRSYDLTAVYFEGIDMMGHRFQHCMPPRLSICPEEDFVRFRDSVTSFYARQDDLIGTILEAAGPGATVLIVSDHGFKSGPGRPTDVLPFTTQQPVEWHDEEGIILLSGPGVRRGATLAEPATLFDVAPTILHLLGLPVAEDMPGRVLADALNPEFARARAERTIATYEGLGSTREFEAPADGGAREAEDELLANLRALGYIGGDAPGEPAAEGLDTTRPPAEGASFGTLAFYHRNLAIYFLKRREYARAIDELLAANERQKLPRTYQLLSQANLSLGREQESIAALHEGLEAFPAMDPEAVLWLVRIRLRGAGGAAAAAREASRFADRTAAHPGLDDAIRGLLAWEAGDRTTAASLFRRSLEADPTRVIAAGHLYSFLEEQGRAIEMETILRRGLAKDDRIDEFHSMLGVLEAETGRLEEALASMRRAAKLDPYNARFAGNLAGVLARLERWEEAATAYRRSAELEPSSETFMMLGSVYRRMGERERALAAFRQARDVGEGAGAPFLGIAVLLSEMGRGDDALAAAREGLDRHPGDRSLRSFYEKMLRTRRTPESVPDRPGSG